MRYREVFAGWKVVQAEQTLLKIHYKVSADFRFIVYIEQTLFTL